MARTGWARDPNMPFTDPDQLQTPGPGSYGGARKPRTAGGVTLGHHASAASLLALAEDVPRAPFASTDERPCLRAPANADLPGPGAYDAGGGQLNLLVTSLTRRTHGRPGRFGSDTERFPSGGRILVKEETPGPGYYDALNDVKGGRRKGVAESGAVFRSTTRRFKGGLKSNTVHIVGREHVPPPTKYNVRAK